MAAKKNIVERDASTGRAVGYDLTGTVLGKVEVLGETGGRCTNGYKLWRLRCSCGVEFDRPTYRLVPCNNSGKHRRSTLTSCPDCAPRGRPRIADNGAHVNAVFSAYRGSAASRGYDFTLTIEALRVLIEQDCVYCGSPPREAPTNSNLAGSYRWNGIDRMDNEQGYIEGNVVSCCNLCNRAKGTLPYREWVGWLNRVAKHKRQSNLKPQEAAETEQSSLALTISYPKRPSVTALRSTKEKKPYHDGRTRKRGGLDRSKPSTV